jgi:hypothetical protein
MRYRKDIENEWGKKEDFSHLNLLDEELESDVITPEEYGFEKGYYEF